MSDSYKGSSQSVVPLEPSTKNRNPSAQEKAWEDKTLAPALRKSPERQSEFTTISNYPVRRLYTPADLPGWSPERDLGYPGEPPYTRGIHSTMHRGRLWTMRQFAGFGTAEDTNQRFRYLLAQGQTGLSTAFDLPTLMGYDSDHPLSEGEVGKCGVAISSLADMEVLFDQIPLADVTTSMTINSPAAIIWAMYLAVAEKQGGLEQNFGDVAERHPQGIHRAKGIHLPAGALHAAGDRHVRIWRKEYAEVQPHFDQRLSHPGSGLDRDSGISVHAA
jgi:methylmalonyl-CoA mutase N-terminal domain/subunit